MDKITEIENLSNKKELYSFTDKIYISIEFHQQEKYIYNNWQGYVSVKNVINGAEACLTMLIDKKCHKILNDNRELVGPWIDANEWIENNWTPRAVNAGLTHFAHIVSPGALAEASALNMEERISGKFSMKLFSDIEQAKNWLR